MTPYNLIELGQHELVWVITCYLTAPSHYLNQWWLLISEVQREHIHWKSIQWRLNGRGGVSNHQPHDSLLNHLFGLRSNETPKLRVTGLCAGNSPVTGEFPAQIASNAENVSIWWRHHGSRYYSLLFVWELLIWYYNRTPQRPMT